MCLFQKPPELKPLPPAPTIADKDVQAREAALRAELDKNNGTVKTDLAPSDVTNQKRVLLRTDADQERRNARYLMGWPALRFRTHCQSVSEGGREMNIAVLGIDLGKTLCSLVGLDREGAVVLRRRIRRPSLTAFVEKQPRCIIGMEACCGAHHLARQFASLGHDVRLMPPEYVKPYVKSQER